MFLKCNLKRASYAWQSKRWGRKPAQWDNLAKETVYSVPVAANDNAQDNLINVSSDDCKHL